MRIKFVILCLISAIFLSPAVFAQSSEEIIDRYNGELSELYNELPYTAKKYIESEQNIENVSLSDSLQGIVTGLFNDFSEMISEPVKILGVLVTVTSLSAVAFTLCPENAAGNISETIGALTSIVIATSVMGTFYDCLKNTSVTVNELKSYTAAFVPIFAGAVTASGGITTAGLFSAATLTAAELIASFITYLQPLCSLMVGISSISWRENSGISGLSKGIKKIIEAVLGTTVVMFSGYIKLQCSTAAAGDRIGLNAGKYIIKSTIPVVGSAVSDALSGVYSTLSTVRNGVGITGIIALCAVSLPTVCSTLLLSMSLGTASVFAGAVDCKVAEKTISSLRDCADIICAFNIVYFLVMVISASCVVTALS